MTVEISGHMSQPHSFSKLLTRAVSEHWCTRPNCTTCGAVQFRSALQQISREDVILGLRTLSSEFIQKHSDLFRLIIAEISPFGISGELLEPLTDTPAGEQLRLIIDFKIKESERRSAYAASQTLEAIFQRRAEKRATRFLATQPHRDRKNALQAVVNAVAQDLMTTPADEILKKVISKDLGITPRVIGSLIYKRLASHYRAKSLTSEEFDYLSRLAELHGGYWKKLQRRIASMHQKIS